MLTRNKNLSTVFKSLINYTTTIGIPKINPKSTNLSSNIHRSSRSAFIDHKRFDDNVIEYPSEQEMKESISHALEFICKDLYSKCDADHPFFPFASLLSVTSDTSNADIKDGEQSVTPLFIQANQDQKIKREQQTQQLLAQYKSFADEKCPISSSPSMDDILHRFFDSISTYDCRTNQAGHLAYIPSGCTMETIIASLITASINRFSSMIAIAPTSIGIHDAVIHWMLDWFGYNSDIGGGLLTSGGSISLFQAIVCAREWKLQQLKSTLNARVSIGAQLSNFTAYVGKMHHFSVKKGLNFAGIYDDRIREIPCRSSDGTLIIDSIETMIKNDIESGLQPFLICSCFGNTAFGGVDDIASISNIAEKYHLWHMNDSCYGGLFALTEVGKKLSNNSLQRCDSISICGHKALYTPYGNSILLVKEKKHLFCNFESSCSDHDDEYNGNSAYLPENGDLSSYDLYSRGIELTTTFRALQIWLPMQAHGLQKYTNTLQQKLDLTHYAREKLMSNGYDKYLEIVSEPILSIFSFKMKDLNDKWSELLVDKINEFGRVGLSVLHNYDENNEGFAIRFCVLALSTNKQTIDDAIEDIHKSVDCICELKK